MGETDWVRQVEKALDVLRTVDRSMRAEAEMNAAKHMAAIVRPTPLAAAVASLVAEMEMLFEPQPACIHATRPEWCDCSKCQGVKVPDAMRPVAERGSRHA